MLRNKILDKISLCHGFITMFLRPIIFDMLDMGEKLFHELGLSSSLEAVFVDYLVLDILKHRGANWHLVL